MSQGVQCGPRSLNRLGATPPLSQWPAGVFCARRPTKVACPADSNASKKQRPTQNAAGIANADLDLRSMGWTNRLAISERIFSRDHANMVPILAAYSCRHGGNSNSSQKQQFAAVSRRNLFVFPLNILINKYYIAFLQFASVCLCV